jgi:hypothetical protein
MDWKSLLTTVNIIIASSVLTAFIIIFLLVKKYNFVKNLKKLLVNPELIKGDLKNYFTKARLLSRSSLVEKVSKKNVLELLDN